MAKVELKGKIEEITVVYIVGEKGTKKQDLILKVPAYVDAFGDVKGKDEFWQISLMGDTIEKTNLNKDMIGRNAKVAAWLNSNMLPAREPGLADVYIINAMLAGIEIMPLKPAATV